MKKMLRKISSAVLVVCVAVGCASAQQTNGEQPTQTRRLLKEEIKTIDASKEEKQVEKKADIYRVSNEPLTQQQIADRDAKIAQGKQNAKANVSTQAVDPNVRSAEKFSSEEEKRAWKQANGHAVVKEGSNERFATESEKEAWIKANPEEYRKLAGRPATITREEKAAILKADPAGNRSAGQVKLKTDLQVAGVDRSSTTLSSQAEKDAKKEAASQNK